MMWLSLCDDSRRGSQPKAFGATRPKGLSLGATRPKASVLGIKRPNVATLLRADQGMVTVEAAFALAAIMTVTALIVAGLATCAAQIAAIDVAGAAARAYVIGVDYTPPRGTVEVTTSSGVLATGIPGGSWLSTAGAGSGSGVELATATATIPAPFGPVHASAVFALER